jgi:protein ImuB
MLWIALHLPLLSLESFMSTLPAVDADPQGPAGTSPVALMDTHHIVSANASAQALGVKPGLKRATALALAPAITLGQADALRDARAITAVAHAALAFTPSVTFDPPEKRDAAPHTVLLEVQASLRYFGGRQQLLRRLQAALAPLGHTVHCASAPTAAGAALLARMPEASEGRHVADLTTLNRLLDAVPLWLPATAQDHWGSFQGMGLRCLSDLNGLPRSGLARRFGDALLDHIDRARGLRPDPRNRLTLPEHFDSRLELFARADTTEQVLHGASLLLARLTAWAAARHAQVARFTLHMQHEARYRHDTRAPADSTLEIALAEPSRDIAHLQVLLRERLANLQLAAPTLELRLSCRDLVQRAPPNSELFPTAGSEREGLTRLIERLQARLGHAQVQRMTQIEDHRPECATACEAAAAGALPSRSAPDGRPRPAGATPRPEPRPRGPPRPVWLLAQPEPLSERQMRPLLDGQALRLLCGPERIESGWWDAALAERDYFIAQASDGALVWIYRARLPMSVAQGSGWFLQGRFG